MSRCSTVAPSVLLLYAVVGSTMPRLCSSISTSSGGLERAGGAAPTKSVATAAAAASPVAAAAPLMASAATAPAAGAPAAAAAVPAAAALSSVFFAAELMMLTAPSTSDTKRKSSRTRGFCGAQPRRRAQLVGGSKACKEATTWKPPPHLALPTACWNHISRARSSNHFAFGPCAWAPGRPRHPTCTSRLRRGPQRRGST